MKKVKTLEEIKMSNYLEEEAKIKTNITPLDNLLQGGFSNGELVQLVGETKTGRTTLALQIAHSFCSQNKNVLFIDAKGDVRTELLQVTSLLPYLDKHFFYVKEAIFTKVEEILKKFLSTRQIDLVIIDSLPSLINERCIKLEGSDSIDSDNKNTNAGTRPLIHLINMLKKRAMNDNFQLLFINEFRNKVDKRLGTLNKVFGPKCLEYESNSIIQVRRIISPKNKFKERFSSLEKANIGISEELFPLKSRTLKLLEAEPFFFEYGIGYHDKYMIVQQLLDQKEITQSGTYYEFKGVKVNGLANLVQALTNNGVLQALVDRARMKSI